MQQNAKECFSFFSLEFVLKFSKKNRKNNTKKNKKEQKNKKKLSEISENRKNIDNNKDILYITPYCT